MEKMPSPTTAELVAMNVRRLRSRIGMSQSALAELMDVATARISEIEHGKSGLSGATIDKLADALDCQPQELLMQPSESASKSQLLRHSGNFSAVST